MKKSQKNFGRTFSIIAILFLVACLSVLVSAKSTDAQLRRSPALTNSNCTSGTLTVAQAKYAITRGGYGDGIILGTRNSNGIISIDPQTGNGVVKNDTNCSLPITIVSYTLNNPNETDYRHQTFHAASSLTIVPPHSSRTLHVDLPRCNFQADFFYSDNYPKPNADRYVKSEYFLDAGYIVNRESAGGFSCNTTTTSTPPPTPTSTPAQTNTNEGSGSISSSRSRSSNSSLRISCPDIDDRYDQFEPVTRRVRISGERGTTHIEWSGNDGFKGYGESVTYAYTNPGRKTAEVTVRDRNRERTIECDTIVVREVSQNTFLPPPLPPPPQYIYLNETPYTGLDDYPFLPLFASVMAFWAIVVGSWVGFRKMRV